MTTWQEQALSSEIEAAVRAVPGVSGLFRVGTLANAIDAGVRLLGIRDGSPFVRLERSPDGLRADIAIGVHEHAGAVETIRRVQAAASAVIAAQHPAPADVRVTVVHINDAAR
jgi:hypothetical protein